MGHKEGHICRHCGSKNIRKNGTRQQGQTIFQNFWCNAHHGYAGRAAFSQAKKKVKGKVIKLSKLGVMK